MKVAIVGSRNWPNLRQVETFINDLPDGTIIISGGAKGTDQTAEKAARKRGLECQIFKPEWDLYGKAAGYKRNILIVEAADRVVAFWYNRSKGTEHTITLAQEAKKPTTIYYRTEQSK